jgi:hypothetical protein
MLIDNFTMNDKTKLYAEWRGSYITLLFQEIRTLCSENGRCIPKKP